MEQDDDPAEEMALAMDTSSDHGNNPSNGGGDDDEEGLMNHDEDDYGARVALDCDAEDLVVIEDPILPPDMIAEDEVDFPERERGVSLRVRQKFSRVRNNMTRKEIGDVGIYKSIKKQVCEAFRSVFQARDNVNQAILHASHNLVKCYKKSLNAAGKELNMKNVFFQQLDLRLNSIIEETSLSENRGRVFKLCATTALELNVLGFDEGVLIFLLDFIDQWQNDVDYCRRANAVVFACFIFETGLSRKKQTAEEQREPNPDKFCDLWLDTALRVFQTLKRGLYDKDQRVRCPAIRGMSVIQKVSLPSAWPEEALEASPRELIVRSIHDRAWECRMTGLRSLKVTEEDVELICNVISYDKSNGVRVAALQKLGECRPNWHPQRITPLMMTAFRDHDGQIRDAARETLRAWIAMVAKKYRTRTTKVANTDRDIILTKETGEEERPDEDTKGKGFILGAQALALIFYLHTPQTKEHQSSLRRLVGQMLEELRGMYHCQQDFIGTFVEQICEDIKVVNTSAALPMIMKSTIATLLDDSDVQHGQDLNTTRSMVFFWRCFIDFLHEHARNPADRTVAISRFMFPLKTMVEYFDVFLVRVKREEEDHRPLETSRGEETDLYVMQMSLVETYLSVMKHAEVEATGREAYKEMLISMMMNPFYQKKILDLIFSELLPYFNDCVEDLLSMVKAKITEMRMKWRGGEFPDIEHTVLVGSKHFEDEWEEERLKNRKITKLEQGKRLIDQYEIKILNCILKTGLLNDWGSEYESRYGKTLRHQIATTSDVSNKVNAIECLGMIGTYDFDLVKDDFAALIRDWQQLGHEEIQATVVVCLTDIYLMNEEAVDEVNRIIADEYGKADITELRSFLGEILVNENAKSDSELLLRSVEAFCRILVNSRFSPDDENAQRSIVSLMHRASLKLTDSHEAKLRSTILTTLSLFSGMSQRNQLLIVNTFPLFFQSFLRNQHIVGLVNDKEDVLTKLKRVGACFCMLTRHSTLPIAEQTRTSPAQLVLANAILDEVMGRSSSEMVEFYLSTLPHIEFEAFDPIEQRKLFGGFESAIQMHDETDAQDRPRISELRKAKKKLARLIGINEDDEVPPTAEPSTSTTVPPSRTESRVSTKPGRGRRGAALSVSSRAGSVARGGGNDDGEESEVDEMADDYEPPEDRRAAARRTAAAAKSVNDMMASPEARASRKPPSRPATATRPTRAPSARSGTATPLRHSSRRLNQE